MEKSLTGIHYNSSQIPARFYLYFRCLFGIFWHPKNIQNQWKFRQGLGEAFGSVWGGIWEAFGGISRLWRRQLAKITKVLRNARGPSLSRDLDRIRQQFLSRPAPPKGGGGSSPKTPRIPPSRPPDLQWSLLFDLRNHIQKFTRFLKAFWLPKCSQKLPKMKLK